MYTRDAPVAAYSSGGSTLLEEHNGDSIPTERNLNNGIEEVVFWNLDFLRSAGSKVFPV